jgi:hypothetical protein
VRTQRLSVLVMLALSAGFAGGIGMSCISSDQVTDALAGYCEHADGREVCDVDGDCCPGFGCRSAVCELIVTGACFVPDGGQVSGSACGCSQDCVSGICTNTLCQ